MQLGTGEGELFRAMNGQVEIDPRRCNGKPVVAGTRIPVTVILDQLAESGSVEAVLKKYPELNRETITAVLRPGTSGTSL